jgi:hypothetical protein
MLDCFNSYLNADASSSLFTFSSLDTYITQIYWVIPPLQPLLLSSPIRVFAQSFKPSSKIICSTTSWRSFLDDDSDSRKSAAYCKFSRTVSVGRRQSCCKIYACFTSSDFRTPANEISPETTSFEAFKRPERTLSLDESIKYN